MGYKTKSTTRIFIAFVIFFITFSVYGQTKKDSLNQMILFNTYKLEFEKYEQQYGKYIQTKNAKMHYLEWGNPKNPTLITHKVYEETWHGVKDQKMQEVLSDIKLFLKKNKLIK